MTADKIASQTKLAKEVWESHDDEHYRQDNSHIKGVGRWQDETTWRAIGRASLNSVNHLAHTLRRGPEFWITEKSMLEWGPGGGSNAFAFRKYVEKYYGVDISSKNLQACEKVLKEAGSDVFVPILLEGNFDVVRESISEPIDIFLSTAVFQHFPSKEYGVEVLSCAHGLMKDGALGHVQIRFDNNNVRYRPMENLEDYKDLHITATSYQIDEFHDILIKLGFRNIFVVGINTKVNYAYFSFRK